MNIADALNEFLVPAIAGEFVLVARRSAHSKYHMDILPICQRCRERLHPILMSLNINYDGTVEEWRNWARSSIPKILRHRDVCSIPPIPNPLEGILPKMDDIFGNIPPEDEDRDEEEEER